MRKKAIAFASVVVAVAAMITVMTAFASNPAQAEATTQPATVAAAAPVVQSLPVTQTAHPFRMATLIFSP